jgi:hypothetical protein
MLRSSRIVQHGQLSVCRPGFGLGLGRGLRVGFDGFDLGMA